MVFESNVPELPGDRTNLIIRAVETFQKLSGSRQNYRIVLEKNIPIGAALVVSAIFVNVYVAPEAYEHNSQNKSSVNVAQDFRFMSTL